MAENLLDVFGRPRNVLAHCGCSGELSSCPGYILEPTGHNCGGPEQETMVLNFPALQYRDQSFTPDETSHR